MGSAVVCRLDDRTFSIENDYVRAFLLEGNERALLIDTCLTLPTIRSIAEDLTQLPVSLLNTHADPDHISGNAAFESFYMHLNEEQNYRSHGGKGEIIPVHGGEIIELGGRRLEVVELFGHTPGSIALLDIQDRTLYSGDAVQDAVIYMFGARRDMRKYIDSLRVLSTQTARFDRIVPSHGTVPIGTGKIEELIIAAEMILEGEVKPEIVTLYGKMLRRYAFPAATFLCDYF